MKTWFTSWIILIFSLFHFPLIDTSQFLTVTGQTVSEGSSVVFRIKRWGPTTGDITVSWSTANRTAETEDYVPSTGSAVIPAGQAVTTVSVDTIQDSTFELDEIFTLTITSSTRVQDGLAIGKIANDDPMPELYLSDGNMREGDPPNIVQMRFVANLTAYSEVPVTFVWTTIGIGTASIDVDYQQPDSGTATIPAGRITKGLTVPILPDLIREPPENFKVHIVSVQNAVVFDNEAVGVIIDND